LNWRAYRKFLTGWVGGGTRFEMTVFYITEIGNAVFQEIEERHYRGDEFIHKNVIGVYRFNDRNKIIHLDIYEQARDSGQWIVAAAKAAIAAAS
jgi:limonene-1,2-epoxide hydrolase